MPSLSFFSFESLASFSAFNVLPELLAVESLALEAFRAASKSENLSLLALNASSTSSFPSF